MPKLIICQDGQDYRVVEFAGTLTIGREADNGVMLASPQVSRHHASIVHRETGEYMLFDHQSTNAIWIEDRKVNAVALDHGVSFRIVHYSFTFLNEQQDNQATRVFAPESHPAGHYQADPATILFSPQELVAAFPQELPPNPSEPGAMMAQLHQLLHDIHPLEEEHQIQEHLLLGAATLCGAGRGFVAQYNEKNDLIYTTTHGFDPLQQNRAIDQQLILDTLAQGIQPAITTENQASADNPGTTGQPAAVCAPLQRAGKSYGCLYLDQLPQAFNTSTYRQLLGIIALHGSTLLDKCISQQRMHRERESLKNRLAAKDETIIRSEKMLRLYEDIRTIAPIKVPVFISGEAGSGKELVAAALHRFSGRKGSYVPLNCAAIPEGIFESELFGSRKGAYHEATDKPGKLELAETGTLFLDEVADMALVLQPKLLRFLENGEITRLGDTRVKKLDVRVVTATNRDVAALIRDNHFRDDLFQRLSCFTLKVPPLRERLDDIEPLTRYFLDKFATEYGWNPLKITDSGLQLLCQYHWPGNVRQLRNVLLRLAVQNQGKPITEREILGLSEEFGGKEPAILAVFPTMDELEKNHIRAALERAGGNISDAAALVGIARSTLYQKMKKYDISA